VVERLVDPDVARGVDVARPHEDHLAGTHADSSKFEEKEIQIGKGIWQLPGTLSLPKGAGPFPVVILVHGSRPNDGDETIGPNKPFRDLAHGLASRGIAVLRYEKRTEQHPVVMAMSVNNITVKEETIDDAVAAVEVLASEKKISRIFVLGHSLGGMLLPRIGKAAPKVAGFISLAGSTRPLEDLVLEQTKYILDGKDQDKLREIERQVAKVKSPKLSENTLTPTPGWRGRWNGGSKPQGPARTPCRYGRGISGKGDGASLIYGLVGNPLGTDP
jgi:dienelactone hydrolase